MAPRRWKSVAVVAGLGAAYFVAAKLGLRLAVVHASATAVWPPTGIALAAFVLLGARVWPAIFAGAFAANLTTAGSVATSLGIATGNTLEGLLGAYLVDRFAAGLRAFERPRNAFRFVVLSAVAATPISAIFGVTSLALGGYARWSDYPSIWLTWWLGDVAGALVAAPVVLLWSAHPRVRLEKGRVLEGVVLLACAALGTHIAFGALLPFGARGYPVEFVCIPFVLWAAFRFTPRETVTITLLVAVIAIRDTVRGLGPFALHPPHEALLLLQAYLAVVAGMGLIVGAIVTERRRQERHLRDLAVRDPLTGLSNYRHLMDVLQSEIQRSRRTERPFAVLLIDVDGLKRINDRYGHLVGSRALCRLADALRASCRAVDTAARYGGDEFAIVLPEADYAAAREVARRLSRTLARQRESPRLSASFGVSLFPRDAVTAEELLSGADTALYEMKGRARRSR